LITDNIEDPVMSDTCMAISSSGTATLELALKKIPTIVIYKTGFLSWIILRNMVKTRFISIVNILANGPVFPELLQYRVTPENIIRQVKYFLEDKDLYTDTQRKLEGIKRILQNKPANQTAAKVITDTLTN